MTHEASKSWKHKLYFPFIKEYYSVSTLSIIIIIIISMINLTFAYSSRTLLRKDSQTSWINPNFGLSTSEEQVWSRFLFKGTFKTRCLTCSKPRCVPHQSCVLSLRVPLPPGQWWWTARHPTVPSWRADMTNSRWELCFSLAASTVNYKNALYYKCPRISNKLWVHVRTRAGICTVVTHWSRLPAHCFICSQLRLKQTSARPQWPCNS